MKDGLWKRTSGFSRSRLMPMCSVNRNVEVLERLRETGVKKEKLFMQSRALEGTYLSNTANGSLGTLNRASQR